MRVRRWAGISLATTMIMMTSLIAPAVAASGAGSGVIEGVSMFGAVSSDATCSDAGRWNAVDWYADDENAFEWNSAVSVFVSDGLWTGSLDVCGRLSRAPGGDLDALVGQPCTAGPWNSGGGRYYGHDGTGQLDLHESVSGHERVVQLRNVTWAPSLSGTFVAWGDYEVIYDSQPLAGRTEGTVLFHWGNSAYRTCLGGNTDEPWGTNTLWGSITLIPTEA